MNTEIILRFECRGEWFSVNEKGGIRRDVFKDDPHYGEFSNDWILLGGSTHHWHRKITVPINKIIENPKLFIGCLVWDLDHGHVRQWGGKYQGKLPRVTNAYIT